MRIIHSLLTLTLISLLTTRLTSSQSNLHHPEFSQNEYSGQVSENAALGTLVVALAATDADGDGITFLIEGESHNFFSLNPSTGALIVQNVLDREAVSFIEFRVVAADDATSPLSSTASVSIVVFDVNDNKPEFSVFPNPITLSEDRIPSPTSPIETFKAIDADAGLNAQISYSLAGDPDNRFFIGDLSGELFLNETLDFEVDEEINLLIKATDGGVPALVRQKGVRIEVTNVDDSPPEFQNDPYSVSISEDTAVGTTFFTDILANDTDSIIVNTIKYTIQSGTDQTRFAIAITGELRVAAALDYETRTSHQLVILAEEVTTVNPAQQIATALITITITDVNDVAPVLPATVLAIASESIEIGHRVTQLTFTDADTVIDSYTFTVLTAGAKFDVDNTGVITIVSTLDYEVSTSETFVVQMCEADPAINTLCDSTTVQVTVTDENDNSPIFAATSYTATITEEQTNSNFLTITATDADDGVFGTVVYSIDGPLSSSFSVVAATGVISNIVPIDRETDPEVELVYIATDTDPDYPRHASVPLIITIMDINDQTPGFLSIPSPCAFDVAEETATDIFTFSTTDGDIGINAVTSVTVDNTDFLIDPAATGTTFTLKTSGVLDRESIDSYTIQLTTTDSGTVPGPLMSSISCTITVTDINDNLPVFGTPLTVSLPENTALATVVQTISATDDDFGANARLTYEFNSGNDEGVFVIDSATGVISLQNTLDYESITSYTLEIVALDAADPPLVGTGTVTVTITDVNDNTPAFGQIRYEFTTTELAAVSSVVGTVTATDGDGDTPNNLFDFAIVSGNTAGTFVLNPSQAGEIIVSIPPTFDMTPSFLITIVVTDRGTIPSLLASSVLVAITVTDTNNNLPVLINTPYSFMVTEGTHANTPVGIISATDIDSAAVTTFIFSLSNPSGNPFQIDSVTGVISTTTNTIDRETDTQFTVTAQVDDDSTSPNQDTESVTITVVDVNDNNPVFDSVSYSFTAVAENSLAALSVGVVSATDADDGVNGMVTFAIIGGNALGYFEIDSSTGVISTTGNSIDFETASSVTLTVEAIDGGLVKRATDVVVSIPFIDLNDNPPSFLGTPYSATISEDFGIGLTVFTAILSDEDTTLVTLTIMSGNTGNAFRTDGMDVILDQSLDFETTPSYALVIQIDDGAATRTTNLPITITDVNDNPPVLAASNLAAVTYAEDRTPALITAVVATDLDSGVNSRLYFTLDDTHGIFQLSQSTGDLQQVSSFNREMTEVYTLQVTVTDGGSTPLSVVQTIVITITDVNEFTPTFTSELYREGILESQSVPYSLGSNTRAMDGDAQLADNGKILHTKLSVLPNAFDNAFSINQATGQLTLVSMLDFETVREVVIYIQAEDVPASGTALSSSAIIIFTISDVNDNNPIFFSSSYAITIFENSDVPATVGVFTANDADSGANGQITYSSSASMPTQFTYDSTTGVLTQSGTFDRENLPHANPLTFQVTATDGGGLTDTADITLTIQDQNDNAPVFSMSSYSMSIAEDFALSGTVLTVFATEPAVDAGTNGFIQYAITHGGDGHFSIPNPSVGEIVSIMTFDRETEDTFQLTVAAYDQSANPLSTFVAVDITINDVNDNTPIFTFSNYHLNVTEGSAPKDVLSSVDILATDIDLPANVVITYAIADPTFTAMTTAGKLAVIQSAALINFETTRHFQVEITAADGSGMTGTATLFITVLDVNDNPPVFDTTITAYTFPESTSGGTVLFTISAQDADSGSNAEIVYSVTSGDDGKFTVQPDTGIVSTTSSPFDFETTISYTVTFTAQDKGMPAMSDTIDITVTITDTNDNEPKYSIDLFKFDEAENDASLTFDISATDADVTSTFNQISYSIRSGSEEGLFVIDNNTGILSLTDTLDRELAGLEILPSGYGRHTLIIQAQDVNQTMFTATTHVEISVTDLNDENPVILRECPIYLTVQEEVTGHAELLTTIPATDADFDQTNSLVYVIASGNINLEFRVNDTGTLEVFGTLLNRESIPSYTLQLEVRDLGTNPGPLTSTCIIEVTVEDSNNNDPIFATNPSSTIPEDTAIDTVLLTYLATDEDIGLNGDIVYTINSGNFGSKFSIGQFDGIFTVIGVLDFETLVTYNLEIFAIDRGTPPRTGTGMITVILTDVNDNSPILVQNTVAYIREDIGNAAPVYTAMATDADSGVNEVIEYSILSGNGDGAFYMDLNSGAITIADNSVINREVTDQYVLNISAEDLGSPRLEDTLLLTITVDDFNDEIPYFSHGDLSIDIIEDTEENNYTGQILLTVTGNDSDIGLNGEFQFRIDAGNTAGFFSVSSDGILTRIGSIDREVYDDFRLTLTIYDLGTPSLFSSIFIDIDITDDNDNSPIFVNTTYTFNVNENSPPAFSINVVAASDLDENPMALSYVIPDSTQPFSVDILLGVVSVRDSLDRETTDRYEFHIECYDNAVHPRTGTTTVVINILDLNDNQPYFQTVLYQFEIPEHFMLGTAFGRVVALDLDLPPNNEIYYHIHTGNDTFAVDLQTGEISIVRDLDRENSSHVNVNGSVIASNTMSYPTAPFNSAISRVEVYSTLSDINDNPPIFTSSWYRQGVLSDTEYQSVVTSVIATDLDLINDTYFGGEISFLADPSQINTNKFRVSSSGNIHVFDDLTSDVGNYFDLYVIASDNRLLEPHFNATTRVTMWVLTTLQQTVITIQLPKPEVLEVLDDIILILQNVTQSLINIDKVIYNPDNNQHTDIYFHAIDEATLAILAKATVIRVVDENIVSVDSLFKDVTVSQIRAASNPVVSLDPFLLILSCVLALLVLICCCLLILCVIYDQVRRKQIKHRQRVSLLKSYDASLDYSLSGQTYENPMWLHPYEQWEKQDDQFTKGNPLFYESQEFIMDMFRESDDEKSEETISFGSWGRSRSKLHGKTGRMATSGVSTITRMSDVDQDYNVELLAEVLGDDLPPSGDEPSEISNI